MSNNDHNDEKFDLGEKLMVDDIKGRIENCVSYTSTLVVIAEIPTEGEKEPFIKDLHKNQQFQEN